MKVLAFIISIETVINADINEKNWLIKVDVMMDLYGVLVHVNVYVIKACNFGEYIDYLNCKHRKRSIDKLIEKCDEDIDVNEMVFNLTLYGYRLNKKACRSYTRYVILLIIVFVLIISGAVFFIGM